MFSKKYDYSIKECIIIVHIGKTIFNLEYFWELFILLKYLIDKYGAYHLKLNL